MLDHQLLCVYVRALRGCQGQCRRPILMLNLSVCCTCAALAGEGGTGGDEFSQPRASWLHSRQDAVQHSTYSAPRARGWRFPQPRDARFFAWSSSHHHCPDQPSAHRALFPCDDDALARAAFACPLPPLCCDHLGLRTPTCVGLRGVEGFGAAQHKLLRWAGDPKPTPARTPQPRAAPLQERTRVQRSPGSPARAGNVVERRSAAGERQLSAALSSLSPHQHHQQRRQRPLATVSAYQSSRATHLAATVPGYSIRVDTDGPNKCLCVDPAATTPCTCSARQALPWECVRHLSGTWVHG